MRSLLFAAIVTTTTVCPLLAQGESIDSPGPDATSGIWVRADYLFWWFKGTPLSVPLLTTDPTNGVSPTGGGLGDPSSTTLLGGSERSFAPFSGLRLSLGCATDIGLDFAASGFYFSSHSRTSQVGGDATGNPFLFRPFVNLDTGNVNAGSIMSIPDGVAGNLQLENTIQLWGADVAATGRLLESANTRWSGLAGFRYLDLQENLGILDRRTDLGAFGSFAGSPTQPGDRYLIRDSFQTRNHFYGAQVGVKGETRFGSLLVAATAKVNLGLTEQIVSVSGSTTLIPTTADVATLTGGILALPSNSGRNSRSVFTTIPEVGLRLDYQLASAVFVGVGYDLLYWNKVARPGNQITAAISAAQLPTSPFYGTAVAAPGPVNRSSDFWAHGLCVSLGIGF